MALTEKKKITNDRYIAKLDTLTIRPLKPIGERIRQAAKDSGKSLQGYILDAVNAQIKIDEDGAEIPPEFITGLIDWLKLHGHTDTDIIDCLSALDIEKEVL